MIVFFLSIAFIIEFVDYVKRVKQNEKSIGKRRIYIIRHFMFDLVTVFSMGVSHKLKTHYDIMLICWGIVLVTYIVSHIIISYLDSKK